MRMMMVLLMALPLASLAHGGRTNAEGCHHDRKRGGYHCHNGSRALSTAASGALAPRYPATTPATDPSPRMVRPAKASPYADALKTPNPYLPATVERVDRSGELYFMSCEQASSAGKGPIAKGEPGYRVGLDPNGNHWACETGEL